MTSWMHLNYFWRTCTLNLKLYNYHIAFVLIYFWKMRKVEFTQCLHFFLVVKPRLLLGNLEKNKRTIVYFHSIKRCIAKKWTRFLVKNGKLPYSSKSNPISIPNPNANRVVILIEGNCLDTSMFLKNCYSRQLFSLGIYFESYCKIPARYCSLFATNPWTCWRHSDLIMCRSVFT